MAPVQAPLRFAQDLLDLAHTQLEHALDAAITQEYVSDWIAAIRKAITLNFDSLTHLHNLHVLTGTPGPPPPYVVKPHMLKHED